jgi:hypothetical protein
MTLIILRIAVIAGAFAAWFAEDMAGRLAPAIDGLLK